MLAQFSFQILSNIFCFRRPGALFVVSGSPLKHVARKKAINIFEIIFIAFQLLPLSFFLRPFPLLPPLPPSRVFLFSLLRPPNVLASAVQSYKCATYRKFNMGNMTWYGQRCEDSHAGKHLNRRERIRSFPRSWRTVTSSATFSHQSKREGRIPKIILILTPGFSSRC